MSIRGLPKVSILVISQGQLVTLHVFLGNIPSNEGGIIVKLTPHERYILITHGTLTDAYTLNGSRGSIETDLLASFDIK